MLLSFLIKKKGLDRETSRMLLKRQAFQLLQPCIARFIAYLPLVGIILLLLLPLPTFHTAAEIDEKGLLVGQVSRHFDRIVDVNTTDISREFQLLGLDTATQRYWYHLDGQLHTGENTYAILRAPRAAGTEALILACNTSPSLLNADAQQLLFSLASYFKRAFN